MDPLPPSVPIPMPLAEGAGRPRRFVFVLLENFSFLSFAGAIEPLRIANRMGGRELYSWRLLAEGGGSVRASNGVAFVVDGDLEELSREDTVVLCGGVDIGAATTKRVVSWLRREARRG